MNALPGSLRWLVRVWVLVAAFAVLAVLRALQVGIWFRDPHGRFFVARLAISLMLVVVLALVDVARRVGRRGWSVRSLVAMLGSRWTPSRLAMVATGLLAYQIVYLSYRNLKSWDVFNAPRDALLQHWDRWLFLGHSPAVLVHDLLGQRLAAYVLTTVYESFAAMVTVVVVAALVFPDQVRKGYVLTVSLSWVWVIGIGSYYLIPSLGPFSSTPQDFAGLPHTAIADDQARYLVQRAYLLAHPQAGDAYAQVSAFASLHVAVTVLLTMLTRFYGLRRLSRITDLFVLATVAATVYFGWHFVVDDVAGVAIAVAALLLGRWTVYGRVRSPRPSSASA